MRLESEDAGVAVGVAMRCNGKEPPKPKFEIGWDVKEKIQGGSPLGVAKKKGGQRSADDVACPFCRLGSQRTTNHPNLRLRLSCDCDSWQIKTGGSSVPLFRPVEMQVAGSALFKAICSRCPLRERRMPAAKEIGQWPWLLISIKREGGIQGWNGSQAVFWRGVLKKKGSSVLQVCEFL